MLSQPPSTSSTPASSARSDGEISYTRLTALLNLVGENPSTLEPLLHELRRTQFYVPVDGNECASLADSSVFCNEREGQLFGLAFLKEADAREYFREHQSPYSLMLCQGSDLVSSLIKREPALGLYLVDGAQGYFLNSYVMSAGAGILDFNNAEVEHVQYAPTPYGGVIPKQLLTELNLLCSKHPHIERVYLSDIISAHGPQGAAFIIVGDHAASPVNVQDILSAIATRCGLADWNGIVTWIDGGENEEILRRNHIDLVYPKKV